MPMCNGADIHIEIVLKNNAVIKTKMCIGGNNIGPMGVNSDDPVSPKLDEICSGDILLQHLYRSYFPSSPTHWLEDENVYFDSEDYDLNGYQKGYERILLIKDFSLVKSITLKERFEWDDGNVTTQQVNINGENCPFINDQPVFTDAELQTKKSTLPKSITSIGKNAFLGCNELNIFVEENTPAHICLKKHRTPHFVIR